MPLVLKCQYKKDSGKKNTDKVTVTRPYGDDVNLHVEVVQTHIDGVVTTSCALIDAEQAKRLAEDLFKWVATQKVPVINTKIEGEL